MTPAPSSPFPTEVVGSEAASALGSSAARALLVVDGAVIHVGDELLDTLGTSADEVDHVSLVELAEPGEVDGLRAALGLGPFACGPGERHLQRLQFQPDSSRSPPPVVLVRIAWWPITVDGIAGVVALADPEDLDRRADDVLSLLGTAIDQLHDAIVICEANPIDAVGRRCVFVSAGFTRATGLAARNVVGRSVGLLPLVRHEPDAKGQLDPRPAPSPESSEDVDAIDRIEAALRAGKPAREQIRQRRRDRTPWFVEIEVVPVFDAGGRHTHWIGVQRDVTEHQLLIGKVERAERLARVGAMAAGVAHEINNPLTFVTSNVEFAEAEVRRLIDDPDAAALRPTLEALHGALRDAVSGGNRLRKIANDLRVFSRVDDEVSEPVDITAVLESAIHMTRSDASRQARYLRDYGEVSPVLGISGRLEQVFLNLLMNATQALPEEPPERRVVWVRTRQRGQEVAIEVEDSGSGIPSSMLDKIFTPFFTTKSTRSGTGLGLHICRHYVQGMNGRIEVHSQLGVGSTFRVTLPATRARQTRRETRNTDPERPRLRILLVEDMSDVGAAIQRALGRRHDVVLARRGAEALQILLRDDAFDVVLCDLMMPETSGLDFLDVLERTAPYLARRFILMTGGVVSEAVRARLDAGGLPLLPKPFDTRQFESAVDRLLQRSGEPPPRDAH